MLILIFILEFKCLGPLEERKKKTLIFLDFTHPVQYQSQPLENPPDFSDYILALSIIYTLYSPRLLLVILF